MVILEQVKPKLVYVPFHTCDATLDPFRRMNVEIQFYALNEDLSPSSLPLLGSSDYFLWIDYYGVCGRITERLKALYRGQLIIDDTHSFYRGAHEGIWSFTSARKHFGVPDGAYLHAPTSMELDAPRFQAVSFHHNILRSMGLQKEAFAAYQQYEGSLTSDVYMMSTVSEGLLRGVDHAAVKAARRMNFLFLEEHLGSQNRLEFDRSASFVPFCYPFLPTRPVERKALHAVDLFIPHFWLDTLNRKGEDHVWEKHISTELLPLPIDHRYGQTDLIRLVDHLLRGA